MDISELRVSYHRDICRQLLGLRSGVPNNADRSSKTSRDLAVRVLDLLGNPPCPQPPSGQTLGKVFSELTSEFLRHSFDLLEDIVPGRWDFSTMQARIGIATFDQYEHLAVLQQAIEALPKHLATALAGDYLVTPDIIIAREPFRDGEINSKMRVLPPGRSLAIYTALLSANTSKSTLHASVSCKWTIRSDRAQNTRTEALNLIRNRKGKTPHIVAVTAEPMPTRLASLALGTGDIDCVYHMALLELRKAAEESSNEDQLEVLGTLVDGRRLRDIADLPFDLVT